MKKIIIFLKKNIVTVIAFAVAMISSIFVPPDRNYLEYFDFNTLSCLFCTLAVVCALKNIGFFIFLAKKIVSLFKNMRSCLVALVCITFIGSMLIANDMALLTFLPLSFLILDSTNNREHMAFVFVLQNIAANLGGMLTPFGNPQNLYLYSKFNIDTLDFIKTMAPPFVLSIILIIGCCFLMKPTPLLIKETEKQPDKKKTIIYLILFSIVILVIFRIVPFWIGTIVVILSLIFLDRQALKNVDYSLLLTFVFFFVFAGNIARIDSISDTIRDILNRDVLLMSTLSCQFISNVPSAILLSNFTSNYHDLLIGVNIGGIGTLIASLASLITFREYQKYNKGKSLKFLALFSVINFSFLIILILLCSWPRLVTLVVGSPR